MPKFNQNQKNFEILISWIRRHGKKNHLTLLSLEMDCVTRWIIFLKGNYDKNLLSVHALIVNTIFCFLLEWKNQTQSFSLLLWNYLLILKILPVTHFKDPKAAILTLKMLTGSRLWFCKIILKVYSRAFSLQPMRLERSALENIN